MSLRALVIGATGITGQNLANRLVAEGWTVYGLSRRGKGLPSGVLPVIADTLDKEQLTDALSQLRPTHLFFNTWSRQPTEKENCQVNAAMIRNVFEALPAPEQLEHVSLVTGLKHYLGPFESYANGAPPATPFRESQPRLDIENFYYAQEDAVFEAAETHGFKWTVHRPHTVIGFAIGNVMNMASTLAVYASICRETGRPFVFPGSPEQWNLLSDVTDARQLASQIVWAATTADANDEAFNVVNGDIIRWKWLWPLIAQWFGIEAADYSGEAHSLEDIMADDEATWRDMAAKYGLKEADLGRLASPWHSDADLGRPIECVTDMSKSRQRGFREFQYTPDSFFDVFERLRAERYIP